MSPESQTTQPTSNTDDAQAISHEIDPYIGEMHTITSEQYGLPCVVAYKGDTAEKIIKHARHMGAVNPHADDELCVCLRHDIGPEFYTEEAIRRSRKTSACLPPPPTGEKGEA